MAILPPASRRVNAADPPPVRPGPDPSPRVLVARAANVTEAPSIEGIDPRTAAALATARGYRATLLRDLWRMRRGPNRRGVADRRRELALTRRRIAMLGGTPTVRPGLTVAPTLTEIVRVDRTAVVGEMPTTVRRRTFPPLGMEVQGLLYPAPGKVVTPTLEISSRVAPVALRGACCPRCRGPVVVTPGRVFATDITCPACDRRSGVANV